MEQKVEGSSPQGGLDYDLKIDIGLVGNMSVGKTHLIRKYVAKDTKK